MNSTWHSAKQEFLEAVHPSQRPQVAARLLESASSGRGLRTWLRQIETQGEYLPAQIPIELIQVYLEDDEVMPLHDCAGCGVAIPVQPGWLDFDAESARVYFPHCPCCGERTGLYAAWSRPSAKSQPNSRQ